MQRCLEPSIFFPINLSGDKGGACSRKTFPKAFCIESGKRGTHDFEYIYYNSLVLSISQTNPRISATSALVSVAPNLAVHLGGTSQFRNASALSAWRPGLGAGQTVRI